MSMDGYVQLESVTKTFIHRGERRKVLDEISLSVARFEFVAVIGPSGCGKTTLLECIAGLLDLDGGHIRFGGSEKKVGIGHAAYMAQHDVLLPWRTVRGNVTLALEIRGLHQKKAQAEVQALITSFGLADCAQYYPYQISGGMQQRAALARTYLVGSDILLLDEPFSKLDALTRREMQTWFLSISSRGAKTVLLVTHDIDEALMLADRIVVLSRRPARIVREYTMDLSRIRVRDREYSPQFLEIKQDIIQHLSGGE